MRTVFIVNPKAGKGRGREKFIKEIEAASKKTGVAVEVYSTRAVGDGEALAAQLAREAEARGEETRIIACGGDGTLNEVLNGAMRHDHVAIGVVPIGTGNDFCRNFPEAGDFLDIEAQLTGTVMACDAIRYSGMLDGRVQTRYCANMFNIGFDCNVVDLTAKLKTYPLLAGSMAYLMAVLCILIKKKGADLRVELDGEICEDGPVLLTALANGSFCGGGVKSAPVARLDDGLMDVNIIYNVSRMEFLSKFPAYSKGTHMQIPGIEKIILQSSAGARPSHRCKARCACVRTARLSMPAASNSRWCRGRFVCCCLQRRENPMKRERTGETDGSMNALCDEVRRAASKYGKRETAG